MVRSAFGSAAPDDLVEKIKALNIKVRVEVR